LNVTETLGTGRPALSVTTTVGGAVTAVAAIALCPLPDAIRSSAGAGVEGLEGVPSEPQDRTAMRASQAHSRMV
jgi:hypothetical protein